jgi:CRP/FNR family transcriptional regulator, cyclic AMP receptor protein
MRLYHFAVIALLQGVPIFAGLAEKALEVLLEHTKEKKYSENGVIVHEGEMCSILFVIGSGSVRLFKNFGKVDQVEFATLGSKDFFGESCILDTLPRLATVQAACPTTVFTISSMAFYHLYEYMPAQHSILLLNIARDLSRRIRALDIVFAARH